MHRDLAQHMPFLVLTYLLASAVGPAPVSISTRRTPPPPVLCHRDDDGRRTCHHSTQSPPLAALAPPHSACPLPRSLPDCSGSDRHRAPGGHVARRGRRGGSARRRGCRGGAAWRCSGPGGRQRSLLVGLSPYCPRSRTYSTTT